MSTVQETKEIKNLADNMIPASQLSSLRPYKTIDAKPNTALYFLIVLSFAMLFVKSIRILGVLTLVIEAFLFVKIKSYILFAFYDEFFAVYQEDSSDTCRQIFWNDIAEWNIQNNSSTGGILTCIMQDKSKLQIRTLRPVALFNEFEKKAKIKESNYKMKASMKSAPKK
ncbi:MAG: hypothetical protein EOM64_03290 [Erysipelotrichia bacterium]|nr:hypothetical protein [Erysipelotrichia bacterium]